MYESKIHTGSGKTVRVFLFFCMNRRNFCFCQKRADGRTASLRQAAPAAAERTEKGSVLRQQRQSRMAGNTFTLRRRSFLRQA